MVSKAAFLVVFSLTVAICHGDTEGLRAKARDGRKLAHLSDAQGLLAKSLKATRLLNVIAIVTKCGDCDTVRQKLKVEQKARGQQFRTVLQPLSMQGVTFVDDGEKSMTYFPDQNLILECPPSTEFGDDFGARMELAVKNYSLQVRRAEAVAGRATVVVVASPKVQGVPARQFFLDEQTLYPLRFTTQTAKGQWHVNMDTQVVSYPREIPNNSFRFDPIGAARTYRYEPAQALATVRNIRDRLGFDPVIPKRLPFGFELQRSELRQNEDGQLAVLWVTDGLATARVYQFRCPTLREGMWSLGTSTVLTENGVTMMMVSDLDTSVRQAIMHAFARREPNQISPPKQASSVYIGVKKTPIPGREPASPQQMFSLPEPAIGIGSPPQVGVPPPPAPVPGQITQIKGE